VSARLDERLGETGDVAGLHRGDGQGLNQRLVGRRDLRTAYVRGRDRHVGIVADPGYSCLVSTVVSSEAREKVSTVFHPQEL
jgi:hypothetical protein